MWRFVNSSRSVDRRPEHLTIGTISSPHGIKGALKVFPHTDWPERFNQLRQVYLGREGRPEGAPRAVSVLEAGVRQVVVQLAGVHDREAAEALRGVDILIPGADAFPLPEGHYYHFELLGLEVWDQHGRLRGRLFRIYPGPANDFYAVAGQPGAKETLLPAVRHVIIEVDLDSCRMIVNWPEQEWDHSYDEGRGDGR